MNESKLKNLRQVSIIISTAISVSNKFNILLLDAILALECCCVNINTSFKTKILILFSKHL